MPNKTTDWSNLQRNAADKAHQQEIQEFRDRENKYAALLAETQAELGVALAINKAKPKIKPIAPESSSESEAVAFAICSDWHVEETVEPATVSGMNEFNLEIAATRIKKLTNTIIRLTEIERNGVEINTLVLALLGDLMTGYIHEELQENNGLSPTQTVIWLRDRVLEMLETIKAKGDFTRIVIPCCYGNHGRTTKKPRHATGAANSYEYMLYQVLAKHAPEFEWVIAEGYHIYLPVYNKLVRLHHGDNVQYQGGIGGLTIPVEKAIASWNKARTADLEIFGHHHQQQQNPKWVSNGSLIGYGGYSLAIKAPFEPPQQTYFLLDSARGRTATWPIFLN